MMADQLVALSACVLEAKSAKWESLMRGTLGKQQLSFAICTKNGFRKSDDSLELFMQLPRVVILLVREFKQIFNC
jgi:hypothetical protein